MEVTFQIDNLQQLINEQLQQNEASARNGNWPGTPAITHLTRWVLRKLYFKYILMSQIRRSSGGLAEIFELEKKRKRKKTSEKGKGKEEDIVGY